MLWTCPGNFCRIRSAFGYGAKKLAGVLKSSRDEISLEFGRFFASTLERSGSGCRPDAADPGSRRNQTPITGAGSISHKERSSGTKQENGESHHYIQEAGTYLTEGGRSHVQYPSWHQQVLASRLQGGLDPSEWVSYVTGNQGDPTLWNRPPTTVSESFLVRGSSRDLGIPVNAVASTSETKQEKSRVIEAGSRTASGNTNIVGVDGQLRHVDGISGLTDSGGGEKGRVQSSGSSHDTPSVAAENSSSSNCRYVIILIVCLYNNQHHMYRLIFLFTVRVVSSSYHLLLGRAKFLSIQSTLPLKNPCAVRFKQESLAKILHDGHLPWRTQLERGLFTVGIVQVQLPIMQITTWVYNKGLQWKLQQAPAKETFRGGTSQVIVSFLHLEDTVVPHQRQKKKVPLST